MPGFFKLSLGERLRIISKLRGIDWRTLSQVLFSGGLDAEVADRMIENALGVLGVPFGIALNFRINGYDYLVPMAVEEPSVIAAASRAAKDARAGGGFRASSTLPLMAAQVQLDEVADVAASTARLLAASDDILARADRAVPAMLARGGGARELRVRDLGDGMLAVHVIVDCREAMGANLLNTVAEAVGPRLAELAQARLGAQILSNYCDERRVTAEVSLPVAALGSRPEDGASVAESIVRVSRFAERDPYRAVTHNKGIMNGVDAVVLATGNDWRAVEAAAHAYAARGGRYEPLSRWQLRDGGATLYGRVELPLAVGVVGGALRVHSGARLSLRLAGVTTAAELAELAACAGLATNFSALRALGTVGIQSCHMPLHRRATEPAPKKKKLGAA